MEVTDKRFTNSAETEMEFDNKGLIGTQPTQLSLCINCSGELNPTSYGESNVFPDIIVKEILTKIPFHCQQTLLNARLVSVQWNRIIEDTSELMRNITFQIYHPKLFLNLPIVKKHKVKSISFSNCSVLEPKYKDDIIAAISNTVEQVSFKFQDTNFQSHSELFKLIMENCNNLTDLDISIEQHQSAIFTDIAGMQIAAANKIQTISVDLEDFTREDIDGFMKFVLNLPKLKEIHLSLGLMTTGDPEDAAHRAIVGLNKYIKKYDRINSLNLKKISGELHPMEDSDNEDFFEFLNLCGKHRIAIAIDEILNLTLNAILDLELQKVPSAEMFPDIEIAHIFFNDYDDYQLSRYKLLHGLRIYRLDIAFGPDVVDGDLSCIQHVQGLKNLSFLTDGFSEDLDLVHNIGIETLSAGLPALEKLDIYSYNFAPFRSIPWAEFLPNLTHLHISWCPLPTKVFSELSVLQSLSVIRFVGMDMLVDKVFTTKCQNRYANSEDDGPGLELIPAITCFKSLKVLDIMHCPLLTNKCVINGIAKCKTLELLKIYNCKKMTRECCAFMQCKVEFTKLK